MSRNNTKEDIQTINEAIIKKKKKKFSERHESGKSIKVFPVNGKVYNTAFMD